MRRVLVPLIVIVLGGCRTAALNLVADAVSESGGSYAKDDDPELVAQAAPFGLKTMEGLLEENPRHEGLLTALASGYASYAYAFVLSEADLADLDGKIDAARAGRDRAKKLLLRARDYGLRGLELRHEGLREKLLRGGDLSKVLAAAEKADVPLLYWTASSWALAISAGKGDMELVAQLPAPVAMMERALALDEAWGEGSIHEFYVSYDATRSAAEGGGPQKAQQHLARALELSKGQKLGARVAFAEGVLVQAQDRAAFTRLLEEVLRADATAVPRFRLVNVLAQRRARALLAHADDLFL
ncbi:MAG TPA: TRAP transporter TatT component family protein [Gemmatimonadaceae bacterium]|nr:TRAP transporter TatT component family protein [Gemmatimonadaceae bacterium]